MDDSLASKIAELIGEASTLFGPGVDAFDSTKALGIVDQILAEFKKETQVLESCRNHWEVAYAHERETVIRLRLGLYAAHNHNGERCICRDCELVRNAPASKYYLREEFLSWLKTQEVNSETIGLIRAQCFVPWDSQWNAFVRDETAKRENAVPNP